MLDQKDSGIPAELRFKNVTTYMIKLESRAGGQGSRFKSRSYSLNSQPTAVGLKSWGSDEGIVRYQTKQTKNSHSSSVSRGSSNNKNNNSSSNSSSSNSRVKLERKRPKLYFDLSLESVGGEFLEP